MYLPATESNIANDVNPLLAVVLSAKQQGYNNQQIIQEAQRVAEVNGNDSGYYYAVTTINQIEFLEKLNRPTIAYNREFLFNTIYQSVLSGMGDADIIRVCGEYCSLDDYAFCQLALQHISVNRVPSEAETANFLKIIKTKFDESIDAVFKLIDNTVNIHFLTLIRQLFIEWYLYPAFLQDKKIDFFLSLADKCNDAVIAEYCRRTADKVSIQQYGQRLNLSVAAEKYEQAPKPLQASDAVEEIYDNQPTIDESGELLVRTLSDFGINATFVGASIGPTFNRIEVKLGRGVKFSSVANFGDDLVQQLGDELGIKIPPMVSSICGRTAFDIPRINRDVANFCDYVNFDTELDISRICIPGGVDVNSKYYEINIADENVAHIMGGGRTGSGKSQFEKAGILYLARRYPPSVVKLALSDVKRVTFNVFSDLPHLIAPVAVEAKDTADLLDYLVTETELRYVEFEQHRGIQNIAQYNAMCLRDDLPIMSRIICFIDEAFDLLTDEMYCDRLNKALKKLLAKARAAGIHVCLYTQRPDKNVLDPLIRSNFPCKTAFSTSRPEDSKIILGDDDVRAVKLLGRGDFLFRNAEQDIRLQALYIADDKDPTYFNQLLNEAYQHEDNFEEWHSGLDFDEFVSKLYVNDNTALPDGRNQFVKKVLRSKPNSNVGDKKVKDSNVTPFSFAISLDAQAKNQIDNLYSKGYSVDDIIEAIFGQSSGNRDDNRRFVKFRKAITDYIDQSNEGKET